MRIRTIVPFALIFLAQAGTSTRSYAQARSAYADEARRPAITVSYAAQREIVAGAGSSFWLQGGGADADYPLRSGLKVAVAMHGAGVGTTPSPASGIPGAGLSLLTFAAGPRYFLPRVTRMSAQSPGIFVESLFGIAHGFNSTFPGGGNLATSANSFALQAGGGVDLQVTHRVSVRVLQADYIRSSLPNGGSNSQNGIRLGAGVQLLLGRK